MGRKIAVRSNLFVLFSTVFVYTSVYASAYAQTSDDLYRQLRKKPTTHKDLTDQAQQDTLNRKRIEKLNQESQEYKNQEESISKRIDNEPDQAGENAEASNQKENDSPAPATSPKAPGDEPRLHGARDAPPPPAASADSPKVAFDPMPDEIKFSGEDDVPQATPTPRPKPPPRKRR